MNEPDQPVIYAFDGFRLDPVRRQLLSADDQSLPLTSRVFNTLLYLVEHRGTLVDKDTLMRAVWPDTVVEENNLNQAIAALRKALGEKPAEHRFIVTEPGHGYRFVAEVKHLHQEPGPEAETAHSTPQAEQLIPAPQSHTRRSTAALYGLVVVLVVPAAAYLYFSRQETPLETIDKQEQAVTLPSSAASDKSVTVVGASLQSVAVLPFADMSPGKDQEYFADGVAEEVLNQLSQIRDLFVVGRTSSFSFKGKDEDLRVIGEKLGVSHLLEGSVRKDGNQVRVSAQLIKAADGYHLWSQTYDRTLEDIFTIQEDISNAVAETLQVSLGLGEFGRPGWTRNAAAYEEYLQGRSHYLKASPQSLLKAVEHYQRAIEIDPAFILARTSLVETFC